MAQKALYDWSNGAKLDEHSRRKLKVLREYFAKYLRVRCSLPQQEKFRLAIVDGFAGGGRYNSGDAGSPLIFLEELMLASRQLNAQRFENGHKPLKIECLLILNDADPNAIDALKANIAPLLAEINEMQEQLSVRVEYRQKQFEDAVFEVETFLSGNSFRNVLFNLDQYGHSLVNRTTIMRLMNLSNSVEVFYTFSISALIAFLNKQDPVGLRAQLSYLQLAESDLRAFEGPMSNSDWMGKAEQIVFNAFRDCAPFHSPFSINNPAGWRYWLVHSSRQYRAREVYNNVLHDNATMQAHFGRSGLNMLSYDPAQDGALYLFDDDGRSSAIDQLTEDIPRLVSASGDAISVGEFYEAIYNLTPAHADDVKAAMFNSPDLEVLTGRGHLRRSFNRVAVTDHLRLKAQPTFFPLFKPTFKTR